MATRKVDCPFCSAVLRVPPEGAGRKGRCRSCGEVFTIAFPDLPGAGALTDDDVLTWLGEVDPARAQPAAAQSAPAKAPPAARPKAAAARGEPKKRRFAIRLGHVDDMGAFFLFDPKLLYDPDFRCAFPVKCVVCGGDSHLSIHLVIWSSKLPWRGQFGMRESSAPSVYELDQLGGRRGRKLLEVLEAVGNLPEPFSLPFPYYVCQACSAVGAIVTDVRFAAGATGQVCELGISSLARAKEFYLSLCGRSGAGHEHVLRELEQAHEDPWRALPLAVRSRIKHWYTQMDGERFLTYIPDGDFAKAEAGIAGVVLTDRRLVYHKYAAKLEVPLTEEITILRKTSGERTQLEIAAPGHKTATLTAGPAGTERLRRCLMKQGAQAHWRV